MKGGWQRRLGVPSRVDRWDNVIASFPGDPGKPSVMVFAHMDQLGFFVRKVAGDGLIRVERMGGVSEKAMAAQVVTLCGRHGDVPGIIMNKAHHATGPEEKYTVLTAPEIRIDTGHGSGTAVEAAGLGSVRPGTCVAKPIRSPLHGGVVWLAVRSGVDGGVPRTGHGLRLSVVRAGSSCRGSQIENHGGQVCPNRVRSWMSAFCKGNCLKVQRYVGGSGLVPRTISKF